MITKYLAIIRTKATINAVYGQKVAGQSARFWQFPSLRLYIRVGELK